MVPHRSYRYNRLNPPQDHDHRRFLSTIRVKHLLFGILVLASLLCVYLVFSLDSRSTAKSPKHNTFQEIHRAEKENDDGADTAVMKELEETLESVLSAVITTSTCTPVDEIQSQVLGHSLRSVGYIEDIVQVVYNCPSSSSISRLSSLDMSIISPSNVQDLVISSSTSSSFGIHPQVLQAWIDTKAQDYDPDDLLMVLDQDSIFLRNPNVVLAQWVKERSWTTNDNEQLGLNRYGQDAEWYLDGQPFPISSARRSQICGPDSPAVSALESDWRPYAVSPPFIASRANWELLMPEFSTYYAQLEDHEKHFAYVLAIAHHKLPHSISGRLCLEHYGSRHEDWDFSDELDSSPCGAPSTKKKHYPVTFRPTNVSLELWPDGRAYQFSSTNVPENVLDCDAWLFRNVPSNLWHKATHTYGYEGITSILRRRHVFALCASIESYNAALTHFKKEKCFSGYNLNRKIRLSVFHNNTASSSSSSSGVQPLTLDTPRITTTHGDVRDTPLSDDHDHLLPGSPGSANIHFLYVTSCSAQDNVESDLLVASAISSHQLGHFSRLLVNCPLDELIVVMERHVRSGLESRLSVVYSNQSLAREETQEEEEERPSTPHQQHQAQTRVHLYQEWLRTSGLSDNIVVVLIEPTFRFLRPLLVNTLELTRLIPSTNSDVAALDRVEPGRALGQERQPWTTTTTTTPSSKDLLSLSSFIHDPVFCEQENVTRKEYCLAISTSEVESFHTVTFPLILSKLDFEHKVLPDIQRWLTNNNNNNNETMTTSGVVVDDTSSIETTTITMFLMGVTRASIKHQIRFQRLVNVVASSSSSDSSSSSSTMHESNALLWKFLENFQTNPCQGSSSSLKNNDLLVPQIILPLKTPVFLNATSVYHMNSWTFTSKSLPRNVFTCDSPLLAFPPSTLWQEKKTATEKRMLFGLCLLIRQTNEALVTYKHEQCRDGYNDHASLRLNV